MPEKPPANVATPVPAVHDVRSWPVLESEMPLGMSVTGDWIKTEAVVVELGEIDVPETTVKLLLAVPVTVPVTEPPSVKTDDVTVSEPTTEPSDDTVMAVTVAEFEMMAVLEKVTLEASNAGEADTMPETVTAPACTSVLPTIGPVMLMSSPCTRPLVDKVPEMTSVD